MSYSIKQTAARERGTAEEANPLAELAEEVEISRPELHRFTIAKPAS